MKKLYFLIIIILAFSLVVSCGTDSNDVKRVGDYDFGFLTIPTEWVDFRDIGMTESGIPHIGFRSEAGSIINLINHVEIEDVDIAQFLQNMGAEYEIVKIDGNDAYRTFVYFEGHYIYLYAWYFLDAESNLRLILAEGSTDEIPEVKEIVENTFSLSR